MISPLTTERFGTNPTFVSPRADSSEKGLIVIIEEVFEKVFRESANQNDKFFKSLKTTINELPVTAMIGVVATFALINFLELPFKVIDLYRNILSEDFEGVVLVSFNLLEILGTILDNIIDIANLLISIDALPKIGFLMMINLPLTISLLSYSILFKSYQIFRNLQFTCSLPEEITEKNIEEFKCLIKAKVDDPLESLKLKKIKILSRHTDPKVVSIMQNLLLHLEDNEQDAKTANLALQDIKCLMNRKFKMEIVSIILGLARLVTVVAGAIFSSVLIVKPYVHAINVCANIGVNSYKTFFFDAKLNRPEFLKA